jgi:OFA family oxalate/formate antiporter-like MFS transporter
LPRNSQALSALIGSCTAVFWPGALTFGFPGVMAAVWQEMFHVGRAATGLTIFFMLAAVGIFMFLVGRWQEHYGPRKMIALGIILTAFASLVAASAHSMLCIYAWAAVNGLASCFVYVPALTLVQWWYPHRRGLAAGTASMVFGLAAGVMAPAFSQGLQILGYRDLNLAAALLTMIFGLAGAWACRPPPEWSIAAFEGDGKAEKSKAIISLKKSFSVSEALGTRSFWLLWIVWTLAGAAGVSMTVLSTGFGLSLGLMPQSAVLILTAFNLTNGAGRFISGILSDKLGRNEVMSLAFLAAGLAYFALPWSSQLISAALLAAVVGFSFGTLFSVSAPLIADCFGLEHFGAIFGLTFAAYGFVAGPLGPTLSGYLLDRSNDNFLPVFLYLGLFCLLAGLCIRWVVPPERN